jgi:hypothetical protein
LLLTNAALLPTKTIGVSGVYVVVISSMKMPLRTRTTSPTRRWFPWFKGKSQSQSNRLWFFVWGYSRLREPNSVGSK